MALDAQILLSILSHESSSGDISRTLRVTPASYSLVLSDGTGANQAQVAWSDAGVIPAGGYNDIDLQGIADDRGTVSFSAIKSFFVRNTTPDSTETATDNLIFIGTTSEFPYTKPSDFWIPAPMSSDSLGSGFYVTPGGIVFFTAPQQGGYSVTPSTKVVRIAGGAGATYEILLIGTGTIT